MQAESHRFDPDILHFQALREFSQGFFVAATLAAMRGLLLVLFLSGCTQRVVRVVESDEDDAPGTSTSTTGGDDEASTAQGSSSGDVPRPPPVARSSRATPS